TITNTSDQEATVDVKGFGLQGTEGTFSETEAVRVSVGARRMLTVSLDADADQKWGQTGALTVTSLPDANGHIAQIVVDRQDTLRVPAMATSPGPSAVRTEETIGSRLR